MQCSLTKVGLYSMTDNAPVVMGQVMMSGGGGTDLGQGVMVYQKTSQCCRCLCCQPNIDWMIHDWVDNWGAESHPNLPVKMFIKENAPWFGRCWSHCWPGWRQTTYTVHAGESEQGPVLFKHEKPATCSHCPLYPPFYSDGGPVRCPWCCCLPYLETKDAQGNLLGTSKYVCDECIFVPKYDLLDKTGKRIYRVRPDVCCGGICPRCRSSGGGKGKCFRIPFPVREPDPPYNPIGDAAVTDLWAGMLHECCTNREMYSVKFPSNQAMISGGGKDADAIKKTLIGMTLLIDITLNEQDQ